MQANERRHMDEHLHGFSVMQEFLEIKKLMEETIRLLYLYGQFEECAQLLTAYEQTFYEPHERFDANQNQNQRRPNLILITSEN